MKKKPLTKKYLKELPGGDEKRQHLGELYSRWLTEVHPVVEVEIGGNRENRKWLQ